MHYYMHYAYVSSRVSMHHYILTTMIHKDIHLREGEREKIYLRATKVRSKTKFENIAYSILKILIFYRHKRLNFKDT